VQFALTGPSPSLPTHDSLKRSERLGQVADEANVQSNVVSVQANNTGISNPEVTTLDSHEGRLISGANQTFVVPRTNGDTLSTFYLYLLDPHSNVEHTSCVSVNSQNVVSNQ